MSLSLYDMLYPILWIGVLLTGYLFWNRNTQRINYDVLYKEKTSDFIMVLVITLSTACLFHLFPLGGKSPAQDSSVFIYIGQMMHKGYIPYKDMFDHKGIMIYFLEYLGTFILGKGYIGIWLIETIFLGVTVYYSMKLAKVFCDEDIICYISVLSEVLICGFYVYEGGNLVEEYALPWITMALYVFLKYFKTERYSHREICAIGAGFIIVSLLRINMVIVWAVFLPIVFLKLIRDKRYADLRKCIVAFIVGMVVILIPTFIYCVVTKCLPDMWKYYIVFNLQYSGSNSSISTCVEAAWNFIIMLWPGFVALAFSLWKNRKNKCYLLNLIFLIISIVIIASSGRAYGHYAIILLPAVIAPVCSFVPILYKIFDKINKNKITFSIKNRTVIIACILLFLFQWMLYGVYFPRRISSARQEDQIVAYLKQNTDDQDDVLLVGEHVGKYLLSGRNTNNKFFYQIPPVSISDDLYSEFLNELSENESDYIVISGQKDERILPNSIYKEIDEICAQKKYMVNQSDGFYVYYRP